MIVFLFVYVFCFVLFFYRIRCADILADRLTDGEWVIAKAVFNGTVTGTVRLVRIITDKVFGTHLMFLIFFLSFFLLFGLLISIISIFL